MPVIPLAEIDEAVCIGCARCLTVCPTDAIIGSAKHMHTVVSDACSGCGLCIPVCPMDCIALSPRKNALTETQTQYWETRKTERETRLSREKVTQEIPLPQYSLAVRQSFIQAALARTKAKKETP